ncbi:amidohydrolase family protein [Massilia sp. Dwa41.01b]|uniref:CIA30 family protein n=1 Tax=Massilia sp. Dwa41.01b TaxID=2709302 RepID=UPI001603A23F|nr:CIA30 family protein [Massilia sp. Dwa41.01b]QNA87885.1 amidohydrolase family protein [Massilia sp. Dwa41.01b]
MNTTTLKTLLLCAGIACSQAALAAATLVRDVRVFDGEKVHERRSVLFENGKIADADFRGAAPAGSRIVEGAGRTLLPGLIDAHTHAFAFQELPVLFGVTTQIDMFTDIGMMKKAREEMAQGRRHDHADLFSAGTLVTAPHGHGTQFGVAIPTITGPEQAQAFVDERIAEGSDFIKIVMESGYGFPSLDLATAKAVIEAAHRRGKLAVVHIGTEKDARAVLEAGADGLVHLFPAASADAQGLARLAASRGAFVIPTFTVLESMAGWRGDDLLADPALAGLLGKDAQAPLKARYGNTSHPERLAAPKAVTAALVKAGVPVLAGTDAGNPGTQYGVSMHREMAALVEAGLTPAQALAAATSVPAKVFKLGGRGRIDKGYKADLLLVEGNPAADILATRRIVEVWKDGESANALRAGQRQQVAQAAREAARGRAASPLPADGRISRFSEKGLASPFGMGWGPSTDGFAGGKSTVALKTGAVLADGEVPLAIEAKVAPGLPFARAGVAFMPGARPMEPVNLSAANSVRFKVRGDGKTYQIMAMTDGVRIPAAKSFVAGPEWTEVSVPFSELKGFDPSAMTMLGFNAGPQPGDYRFEIADVRLLAQ